MNKRYLDTDGDEEEEAAAPSYDQKVHDSDQVRNGTKILSFFY